MFCKKAILVNWGNIPPIEFDFGPVNLFSGGNGSGKTTAADALQTLMTAAHENLFNYNPGQDETSQRGRGGKQVRTLASYILGCDDGSYARPAKCQGYIAALFHPTQGESGQAFWAIMAVQASLETAGKQRQARQDELLFLIAPSEHIPAGAINLATFVKEDKGGKYILPMGNLAKNLRIEFGQEAVESYDKKSSYLRRLYGALRGQGGAVSDREAKHAAKTFSNFMAYKPVKSINEFVAKEVLEPKDLSEDIRQVSELMKTIHGMEQETRALNESIDRLEDANGNAVEFLDIWQQIRVLEYAELYRRQRSLQKSYLAKKDQQQQNQLAAKDGLHSIELAERKKSILFDQITELSAKRKGISALKDKDELQALAERSQQQLSNQAPRLLQQLHSFSENYQQAQKLLKTIQQSSLELECPSLAHGLCQKALKQVISLGDETGIDAQKLMTIDFLGSGDLERKLEELVKRDNSHQHLYSVVHHSEEGQDSLRDQLFALAQRRREKQDRNRQQIDARELEVQRLGQSKISYPGYIQQALNAIEQECPEAKPAVLCDFIEVSDPQWQMAIEGYIGGARFGIIVEADYEAEAIAIVRNIGGRRGGQNRARVIQGHKAARDASRLNTPKGSIVELMEFSHKTAEYYIRASYGSVVRAEDEQELRGLHRGLCANGIGAGNYAMFRCDIDAGDLLFGQGARDRAVIAKREQIDELLAQSKHLEISYREAANCLDACDKITAPKSVDIVHGLLDCYRELEQAEQDISNLDLSEFDDLEAQLQQLKGEHLSLEKQINEQHQAQGEYKNKSQQLEIAIDKLADEQDSLQRQLEQGESAVDDIAKHSSNFDSQEALSKAEHLAANASDSLLPQCNDLRGQLEQIERKLDQQLSQHNQLCNSHCAIPYLSSSDSRDSIEMYQQVQHAQHNIDGVYHSLKNNVLVGKHENLLALKDSFNTAFVSNLCHSIYQAIGDGKEQLEVLNLELQHHRFGDDRERFFFGYDWIPEFKEYYKFFKEVIDTPDLGDGNSLFDAELSKKSQQVRDKLLTMLLDKDEQTALRELNRISDYRNYRNYEIYKEPLNKEAIALSTYGTGSGGQLETPAYIIRAAAVTSAFRFNEGNTHCRMVLVDEAFSKMDETRSRQVIHYLTESLGLQLLFIMPTSKSGPFMDLISHQTIFSKCPATQAVGELQTRVLVDRKICNTDKIKELWAKHRKTVRHQAMLDFMEGI
ncbi:SbcC/MukB-like Walker B domain-containing protein [uncultured Pseudoteredinibacter sp.]|uniref:ATP-binding protein n=1 Tax=uncultured Pseudoteredinibacter sp. TaxID=1641701 RepID=UPI002634CE39|nr:SbcC/MukB-like Walker B domain-containing protein [uncultured Pseudoteredinibacter sp.]